MSKELSIINAMLAESGALPLSASDDHHPNYIAAMAVLQRAKDRVFSKPLWFNTERRTLRQNGDGEVILPNSTMQVDPVDPCKNYVEKGGRLWNATDRTFVIGEDVEAMIVYTVNDLDDVPQIALNYLTSVAVLRFLSTDAEPAKMQIAAAMMREDRMEFEAENLAARDVNYFNGAASINFRTRRSGRAMSLPPYE